MTKTLVSTSGFRDLDKALAELPKTAAKAVLRRTLLKAGEPIAAEARQKVPFVSGDLRDSIQVSSRVRNNVGKAEFAAAMRAGLGKGAARQALRDARRAAGGGGFVEMFVGPTSLPYAHLVEFGSVRNTPKPYLRPAWDGNKRQALDIIKAELGREIIAGAKRIARSKKQSADVKYRASLAALMAHEAGA